MKLIRIRRLFAVGFALALASLLGAFAYQSSAVNAGGLLFVHGSTTGSCGGRQVGAGYQDSNFSIEAQQFWPGEPVTVSFTFPDGRVLSPVVTSFADNNSLQPSQITQFLLSGVALNGLDGVIDMPANFPWVQSTSIGGDYVYPFPVTNKWPYGCYTFTALGGWSNRQAQASFQVLPRSGPTPNAGPATLTIEDNTTGDPSSQQGAFVNIFGRGFVANEVISLWITAPDGAVFSFPYQPMASDIGSFSAPFIFDANHPTGTYAFTALGNSSGYQVIGRFNLSSRASPLSGYAQLRVAHPSPASGAQGTIFQVQGKLFYPHERVDIWMTLPDGAVRGLPSQFANEFGEFYADISLDERLPVGEYDFTAKGEWSGFLVISTLRLTGGDPNVTAPVDAFSSPFVEESNSGTLDTLGPPPEQLPPFETPAEPLFPSF
jgi:hypothetical protein